MRIDVKDLGRSHLTSTEIRAEYGREPGPNANLALLGLVILLVAAVIFSIVVLGEALDLGAMSRAIEDAVRQPR